MTPLEQQVWAAAFAAEFATQHEFNVRHGRDGGAFISGFNCAETADVAVLKLREALTGSDREYLLPVSEAWEGGAR